MPERAAESLQRILEGIGGHCCRAAQSIKDVEHLLSELLSGEGKIVYLDSTGSTMDEAASAIGGLKWVLVWAGEQRYGRGRLGRRWESPRGGLWLTLAVRAGIPCRGFQQALGAAVAESLSCFCGVNAQVKWPNDIVVGGRKLAGILVEAPKKSLTLVGLGLNVLNKAPPGGASLAEIADCKPIVGSLLAAVSASLAYAIVKCGEAARLYKKLDYLAGRRVIVDSGRGVVSGVARGVDEEGRLIVESGSGTARIEYGSVLWAEGLKYE